MARIVPIYSLSENLNIKTIRKAIYNVLESYESEIETVLPEFLIKKYNLLIILFIFVSSVSLTSVRKETRMIAISLQQS